MFRMLDLNADYATFFDSSRARKRTAWARTEIRSMWHQGHRFPHSRGDAAAARRLLHGVLAPSFSLVTPDVAVKDWRRDPSGQRTLQAGFHDGQRAVLEKNDQYWDAENVSSYPAHDVYRRTMPCPHRSLTRTVHWLDGPETYEEVLLETAILDFPIYSTHYWFCKCRQHLDDQG